MDANFSSLQYLCPGWPEFFGRFCFQALILSDQNLISHDWPEFQIKKIHQQCVQNITPKKKGYIKLLGILSGVLSCHFASMVLILSIHLGILSTKDCQNRGLIG